MGTTDRFGQHYADFYCSSEWHLASLSRAASLIYSWALRIQKNSGRFRVSPGKASDYFRISVRAAARAYAELRNLGFFVLLESGKQKFEASIFTVLTHSQWQKSHPGNCVEKFDFPWSAERDELQKALSAAADGRIPFRTWQVAWYCQTGLSDVEILGEFKMWHLGFQLRQSGKKWRKGAAYHFGQHLKSIMRPSSSHARKDAVHVSR
jgi:hypothetical protein